MGVPDALREALADRYTLDRELGRGGMAVVYLAQDLRHDRPVAALLRIPCYLSPGWLRIDPTFDPLRNNPRFSIVALPTPGHSPGHTSFPVRRSEGGVLLAGDVTYDLPALYDQREQGFVAEVEEHRRTLPRVLSLVRDGVAYLPSHDPESPARLGPARSQVHYDRSRRLRAAD